MVKGQRGDTLTRNTHAAVHPSCLDGRPGKGSVMEMWGQAGEMALGVGQEGGMEEGTTFAVKDMHVLKQI